MKKLIIIAVFILTASFLYGQVVHVRSGATGNGSSWTNATGNLQQVLANAAFGTEIWVAAGTYHPVNCNPCAQNNRTATFTLGDGVKLYGGFSGTETTRQQRNSTTNLTILSGDLTNDGAANPDLHSYTVITTRRVSNATVLDGFIIEYGNANSGATASGKPENCGGGWYNDGETAGNASSPKVANCIFRNNFAVYYGGGAYQLGKFGGSIRSELDRVTFEDNNAVNGGGGMCIDVSFGGSLAGQLTNGTFRTNRANQGNGGGLYLNTSESAQGMMLLNSNTFAENTAFENGGGFYDYAKTGNSNHTIQNTIFQNNSAKEAGAYYCDASYSGVATNTFSDCMFLNNTCEVDGGAIFQLGYADGSVRNRFINTEFRFNHSMQAGAACFNNGIEGECSPIYERCRFIENIADSYGGALYNHGKQGKASPRIVNCVFAFNQASSAGGVYCLGSENGESSPLILNSTFYKNTAFVGGAIYSNGGDLTGNSTPEIANCIIYGNVANFGADLRTIYATPYIHHSIVDTTQCSYLISGTGGNINCGAGMQYNVSPSFIDGPSYDFRLSANSPAIDRGDNGLVQQNGISLDQAGQPRTTNGTTDIGAFEYQGNMGVAPSIISQPQGQTVCAGSGVTFTVAASGSGNLTYQWRRNSSPISGANQPTLTIPITTLMSTGNYSCQVNNSLGSSTSSAAVLTVLPTVAASVVIDSVRTSGVYGCSAANYTLTATLTNQGAQPQITWTANGQPIGNGTSVQVITTTSPKDIRAQLVSNATCVEQSTVSSNTIRLQGAENVLPAVAIDSTFVSGVAGCENAAYELTAQVSNGGTQPVITWYRGTQNVGSGNTYQTAVTTMDVGYFAKVVSNANCLITNTQYSTDTIHLMGAPRLSSSLTITGWDNQLEYCPGDTLSLTASLSNNLSGDFFWLYDGTVVSSVETLNLALNAGSGNLQALAVIDELCAVNDSIRSSQLTVTVKDSLDCFVATDDYGSENKISAFPNPFRESVTIRTNQRINGQITVRLSDVQGRELFVRKLENWEDQTVLDFSGLSLSNGMYLLSFSDARHRKYFKLVKEND